MDLISGRIGECPVPFNTDKIVRRLDEFPELLGALRDGDLLTARLFCARIFDFDGRRNPAAPAQQHQRD